MTTIKQLMKWPGFIIAALAFAAMPVSGHAEDKPQEIVDGAVTTLNNFSSDPNMSWFQKHIKDARGVFIVPSLVKAGFILGGSGGSGVLLTRVPDTPKWSYPAFYTMGSGSFGLQAGVEKAEVVLLVMTEKGVNAMLSNKFQLGADASVAAGPVGIGAQAATADILQFSRSKGIFGGLTVEGAVIAPREKWNQAYYGKELSPVDILVRHIPQSAGADPLRKALVKLAR
jgi:lipid-binding SYLF domain-containing protein